MEFYQGTFNTIQDYSLLSALVVLICEYIHCFDDEVKLIWSRRWTPVKCAYLFSRYGGIVMHLANYLIFRTKISYVPVPSETCLKWYAFQTATMWSVFTVFDAVIMLRVYALHRKSTRIRTYLVTLYLCEVILISLSTGRFYGSTVFDGACNVSNIVKDSVIIAGGVIAVQSIIWSLTFKRRDMGNREIPIVMLVLRDKKWIWCLLCAIYAILSASYVRQNVAAHMCFAWPGTALSMATCRLVLNMQATPLSSSEIELSPPIEPRFFAPSQEAASVSRISALTTPVSYPPSTISRFSEHVDDLEYEGTRISTSANSSIDIGSCHTSSSMNSQELRQFWKGMYD